MAHWKRWLEPPSYMLRNIRPHPGSQTLASNLSKTQKHIQDMFTHSLFLAWPTPKHAGSMPTAEPRPDRLKSPQWPPIPVGLGECCCWLILPVRGRKVCTVQIPPLPSEITSAPQLFLLSLCSPNRLQRWGATLCLTSQDQSFLEDA